MAYRGGQNEKFCSLTSPGGRLAADVNLQVLELLKLKLSIRTERMIH